MINYTRCSEENIDLVYEAFKGGFSDYIIQIDLSKEDFIKRFFGPEGNSLQHSFLAMEDENPIGVILGGIKVYEGIKTMRCGTLAVKPDYRGKNISNKLFDIHREEALRNECKQLFLEVIVGNDRAINFYKKLGYEKIYDLSYFSMDDIEKLKQKTYEDMNIKRINIEELESFINNFDCHHINWQNDIDYIKKSQDMICYGYYNEKELIGCICINTSGKISFLGVKKNFRNRKIGLSLLKKAIKDLSISKSTVSFPNNSLLEGFFKHLGFKKDKISQYEMYTTL